MAQGGRPGGQGGPIKRGLWMFFCACFAVALWNGMPHEPQAFVAELQAKSANFESTVRGWVAEVGLTDDGSIPNITLPDGTTPGGVSPGGGSPAETTARVDALPVGSGDTEGYDRDEWRHWDNLTACWTVREEVLLRDAQPGSVTLRDANGKPTTDKAVACEITGGSWIDPYTGETFTNPEDLDIDHMVALGAAAKAGGQGWDTGRKLAYANDLSYRYHLLAVSASANRAKGDKTPADWKPKNQGYWCQYATSWTTVKGTWGLSVTDAERAALKEMLGTCS